MTPYAVWVAVDAFLIYWDRVDSARIRAQFRLDLLCGVHRAHPLGTSDNGASHGCDERSGMPGSGSNSDLGWSPPSRVFAGSGRKDPRGTTYSSATSHVPTSRAGRLSAGRIGRTRSPAGNIDACGHGRVSGDCPAPVRRDAKASASRGGPAPIVDPLHVLAARSRPAGKFASRLQCRAWRAIPPARPSPNGVWRTA